VAAVTTKGMVLKYETHHLIQLLKTAQGLNLIEYKEMMGHEVDGFMSYPRERYGVMKEDLLGWLDDLSECDQRRVFDYAEKKLTWNALTK
jgi:hypothetical protein